MTHGQIFGRLTVKGDAPKKVFPSGEARRMALCACICGNEVTIDFRDLRSGKSKSCGCLRREVSRFRISHSVVWRSADETRMFHVWRGMIRRCESKKSKAFKDYGARGIKVCERWHDFNAFISDMGIGAKGMTIERKENNGDYEPGNCIWLDRKSQNRNRRDTVFIEFMGKRQCMSAWAEEIGVHPETLRYRLGHWTIERALTTGPGWQK